MEGLPLLSEAEIPISRQELETLATAYAKELEAGAVRPQTKFDYAWALVRNNNKPDQQRALTLLHEIYKENASRRRECLYYLALGSYKLGQYRDARKYNETLLQMEPRNGQALQMRKLIDDKVRTEGLVGMGIVGGVVLVAGLLTAGLVRKATN